MHTCRKIQGGFSLVEMLTIIAMMGLLTGALYTLMNNMNAQTARMNVAAQLVRGANQINSQIETAIARAGYQAASAPPISRTQALRTPSTTHIQICADNVAGNRQLTEFRLSAKENGRAYLQKRVSNTNCTANAAQNWENISERILTEIIFTLPQTASGIPPRQVVQAKYVLQENIAGADEIQTLTQHHLLPSYSLIGLEQTP